jgi:predicted negative regulator of RcsB-dependent stress response
MQMKNGKKLASFIIVLSITVYGAWCIWDYFSLINVSSLRPIGMGRIFSLHFVIIMGIWMGWSGLWNIVNAGQDWNRSVGYMKIMGGTALIIITNLFLYVLAQ